jgi:hypothetical protein
LETGLMPETPLVWRTCRNTGKDTLSMRKKLWETLGENGWMNNKKQHRTDDKRSPKVYYCVSYRPSALMSINNGINIGSNEPDPPWYPGLRNLGSGSSFFFSLNFKLILVLKNRPSFGLGLGNPDRSGG